VQGKSWHEIDSSFYNFCLCNKNEILLAILIGLGSILLVNHGIIKYKKGKIILSKPFSN
jgi:hypothetical protein